MSIVETFCVVYGLGMTMLLVSYLVGRYVGVRP